jgi:aspartyl-tRNA(Asn)/glutamyl-tRNA(Gln) amidotransferase subunit C
LIKNHITKEQIEHIAWLARLYLTEEEKEKLLPMCNEILAYFWKMNEVDTSDIEYISHGVQIKNVMRDDIVVPSLPLEESLKNAPKKDKTYIKAPRMV